MTKNDVTKRHCMVVYAGYPWGETRVQREAEALVSQGYEVDVISLRFKDTAPIDSYQGVRIYREKFKFSLGIADEGGLGQRFLKYLRFFWNAAIRLTRLHRQQPYDTIQVHNLPDFLVFTALIPKLRGIPVILDLHDLMPEFYAGRFGQDTHSLLGRLIRWQESVSCRFADHVITVSEHWRQSLINRGVPAQKCSVVMNLADTKIFYARESHPPDSSSDAEFRMIYHGTIVERYGLDMAIKAVAQIKDECPGIYLTLLGRGRHVDTLFQLIEELGVEEYVNLINDIRPAEELPEIILAADIGIVPYRNDVFTDGLLPTKLMEYAALGIPSIASRTTTIQAYFADTMVEFFEPGDLDDLIRCIRTLYQNSERLSELTRGCTKFNEKFNWTKSGGDYVALVERLGSKQK
jgi:glycosyltransferase involved in cell wall biosynthesis